MPRLSRGNPPRSLTTVKINQKHIYRIESGAEFSFDFVTYLVAAAAIAFMGNVDGLVILEIFTEKLRAGRELHRVSGSFNADLPTDGPHIGHCVWSRH